MQSSFAMGLAPPPSRTAGWRDGLSRREFLQASGAAAAGLSLGWGTAPGPEAAEQNGVEDAGPETLAPGVPQVRVLLREQNGSPLNRERARTLIARDLANDPLPQAMSIAEGRARVSLAPEPLQLGCRLSVPGFGEVYCYADNDGRGYSQPGTIQFVERAAATRLRRVRHAAECARRAGVPRDLELERRISGAAQPFATKTGGERTAAAYAALRDGLHAGERLVLNVARHRIARFAAPRASFLFGCLASNWDRGREFERRFTQAFNFGTISWYTWSQRAEPVEQRIDYTRQDRSLEWCLARKITPKGFGYVYLTRGATPDWFRVWPREKVLPEYRRMVGQTMARYADRMPYVEVINEAHDKANLFHFTQEEVLELTREACRAAREGAPRVKRVINHCCLWAEYGKRSHPGGQRRWSPWRYLKDCLRAGVEFDVVGLQLYYPQHDLFEINAMLDRFAVFDRPMHITEMSCNSAEGLDPASLRPKSLVPGWHGPWTESVQADWAEGIYTLCYSKPEFEGVGWWDLADTGGHFWPHGGLLRKDYSPKESYTRLLGLQKRWGVEMGRRSAAS